MGRTPAPGFATSARHRATAPTRLGLTLRSVALAPRDGFAAAFRTSERRARAGERPPEGWAPYVLGATGGAAVMSLWLKAGARGSRGGADPGSVDPALLVAALVAGALLVLGGQLLWGVVGPWLADRLGGCALGRDLRLVWGAAALPQTLSLAVLVVLDLLVVGPSLYGGGPLADPLGRAWAALSIALALALAVWSLWLFVRGLQVAGGLDLARATALAGGAVATCALVVGTAAALAAALAARTSL
jgi:hypothetical protein